MPIHKIVLITICRAWIIAFVVMAFQANHGWVLIVDSLGAAVCWMMADGVWITK